MNRIEQQAQFSHELIIYHFLNLSNNTVTSVALYVNVPVGVGPGSCRGEEGH